MFCFEKDEIRTGRSSTITEQIRHTPSARSINFERTIKSMKVRKSNFFNEFFVLQKQLENLNVQ